MTIPIILTLILIAYGILNIPLVNQFASPFIAVVLIFIVWKLWDSEVLKALNIKEKNTDDIYALVSDQQKEIQELKEMLAKLISDKDKKE